MALEDRAPLGEVSPSIASGAEKPAPTQRIASYTMLLLFLAMTFAQLDLHIASYVAGNIKSDFHLTDTQLGLLLGASFGLFYTLVGVPLAWFIDRYSRRIILGLGIIVWSLGTACCGVAQSYWSLFVARLFGSLLDRGDFQHSFARCLLLRTQTLRTRDG